MTEVPPTFDVAAAPPPTAQVAAYLAARMCHDFISPASAIVSGLDLLDDPTAQDMREEAMGLIASSARKLADLLAFTRVAFGASASADTFDARELEKLTRGVFAHVRAELDWEVGIEGLNKPAARALLNLAQMGGAALPTGGTTRVRAVHEGASTAIAVHCSIGKTSYLFPTLLNPTSAICAMGITTSPTLFTYVMPWRPWSGNSRTTSSQHVSTDTRSKAPAL